MGAFVRYKNLTGKELRDVDMQTATSEELMAYFYCCVASACSADNVQFDYTFLRFCDVLEPDKIAEMSARLNGADVDGEEKKTANI